MIFVLLLLATSLINGISANPRILYALNAGGPSHVDSNGVSYLADTMTVGTASDYGMRIPIKRVSDSDQVLYQTERWHDETFHYTLPINEDGDFVLVLKFAEVYFFGPSQKLFDVRLNDQHVILRDLDIFNTVGNSVAHDVTIPFTIQKGKMSVGGQYSTISNQLKVEFVKGNADNPKICAFYLMKGKVEDAYRLPSLENIREEIREHDQQQQQQVHQIEDDEDADVDDDTEFEEPSFNQRSSANKDSSASRLNKKAVKSGRPATNPYEDDHTSLVLPIVISLSVFVPTVLFMCRLWLKSENLH